MNYFERDIFKKREKKNREIEALFDDIAKKRDRLEKLTKIKKIGRAHV